MIRQRVVKSLRELAIAMDSMAAGCQWHLFGSVDRDCQDAEDIDLMILCNSDQQADSIRQAINPDFLGLPLHLALLTFEEAVEIDAVHSQGSSLIFP